MGNICSVGQVTLQPVEQDKRNMFLDLGKLFLINRYTNAYMWTRILRISMRPRSFKFIPEIGMFEQFSIWNLEELRLFF
jgi:hypothetical protein